MLSDRNMFENASKMNKQQWFANCGWRQMREMRWSGLSEVSLHSSLGAIPQAHLWVSALPHKHLTQLHFFLWPPGSCTAPPPCIFALLPFPIFSPSFTSFSMVNFYVYFTFSPSVTFSEPHSEKILNQQTVLCKLMSERIVQILGICSAWLCLNWRPSLSPSLLIWLLFSPAFFELCF